MKRLIWSAGAFALGITVTGCFPRATPPTDPFYQAILAEQPEHPIARYSVGQGLLNDGQFEKAVEHFKQSVRLQPGSANAWQSLGKAQLETGDYSAAGRSFERALELGAGNNARIGLASTLIMQGSLNQAEAHLAIVERDGASAITLRLRGDLAYARALPSVALDFYRQSLAISPNQPDISKRTRDLERFLASRP